MSLSQWNPDKFIILWNNAYKAEDKDTIRKLLIAVAEHNYHLIKVKKIYKHFPITVKYSFDINYQYFIKNIDPYDNLNKKKGMVCFDQLTTDAAIVKYNQYSKNGVVALNFANAFHVGGGYLNGAIAQEEELCRQYPSLYASLNSSKKSKSNPLYPIEFGSLLFTENVERIRGPREFGYPILSNSNVYAAFITTAAPNMMEYSNVNKNFSDFESQLNKSLSVIMSCPHYQENRYNVLILGAWGSGAFAPSEPIKRVKYIKSIAKLIAEYTNRYRYMYDIISISIPDKNGQNYQLFAEIFNKIVPNIVFT